MKASWAILLILADLGLLAVTLPRFQSFELWEMIAAFGGLVIVLAIGSETLFQALRKSPDSSNT